MESQEAIPITGFLVTTLASRCDFQSRAQSSLCGGDDLISKPILPMELAAKAVMHLVKRQMSA